ncbi:ABC transporter permease [Anaerocolumna sp. MB42-C2]|uniref:ABC transporter permease n=1 Tax=Anaerocolumna sp. MB42-C2 TaxID=3070997 RepID=UPI0027E0DEC0|nr:ABC-2 family transporter protein [Anaerocolumna sp. MB42-C2]WMJ85352.1 ABC-2 family transporter protein [Anaerocolumna sp. MB42-C2]
MNKINGNRIRTGKAFIRTEFFDFSIYRASFWLRQLYTFLMMYSVGYVWKALYASSSGNMSVGLSDTITYAVLGVALESIMHPSNGPQMYMMQQVRRGSIEMDIMKPLDFQFYMFCKNMGQIIIKLLFLVIPSLVVAYFFFGFTIPGPGQLLVFLLSLSLGILVSFLLNFILGLLSMITMNIRNINWGYNATLRFFAGQMVPLWLFPGFLSILSNILPFRCIYAIPMSIYIGNYSGLSLLGVMSLQLFWIGILFIGTRLLMNSIFKRLLIQGG